MLASSSTQRMVKAWGLAVAECWTRVEETAIERVINGETDEVEDYLLVGQRVWQLAFTPDEKYLFTTNGNSNDVSVIDVAANKVVKSIAVGQQPWGVVVAPN